MDEVAWDELSELPKAAVGEKRESETIDEINESIMKSNNFLFDEMVDEFDGINWWTAVCASKAIKEILEFLYWLPQPFRNWWFVLFPPVLLVGYGLAGQPRAPPKRADGGRKRTMKSMKEERMSLWVDWMKTKQMNKLMELRKNESMKLIYECCLLWRNERNGWAPRPRGQRRERIN